MQRQQEQPRIQIHPPRPIPAILAVGALAIALVGCVSRQAPAFQVVAVDQRSVSDTAVVLDFTVEGTNPNPFELPLRDVHYTVAIDGAGSFNAVRSAEATLPRSGSQRFVLPAVVSLEEAQRLSDFAGYRLSGSVEYQFPDPLSDVLFDASLRRPRASIGIAGELDFTGTDVRTTVE